MRSSRRQASSFRLPAVAGTAAALIGLAGAGAWLATSNPNPTSTSTSTSTSTAGWLPADPDHRWSFPRDHWAHPGHRTEWWYFTGTLESLDAPGRHFGFQVTFFSVGLVPDPPRLDSAWATGQAVMVHVALTDVSRGAHHFSEVLWRASPLLGGFGAPPDPLLAWARAPPGTDGRWTLALDGERFQLAARDAARALGLELVAAPTKPPALQGPNGYSRKSDVPGYASRYYSLPRLALEGSVEVGGERHRVRGEGWMDQEVGSSQLAPAQVGWDWWSLRLADGRDLMLYVLRRADGSADFRKATLVGRDGAVKLLPPDAWSAAATGRWRSPSTGAEYPSGWDVRVPGEGIALRVEPEVREAENVSALVPGLAYWEGPVRLTGPDGQAAGEGYVELTGYGEGARPPI
jgi:predicted secreted hydrolase